MLCIKKKYKFIIVFICIHRIKMNIEINQQNEIKENDNKDKTLDKVFRKYQSIENLHSKGT